MEFPVNPEDYTELGWRIFPVRVGDKLPAVDEWQKGAPVDVPFNIGVVTGESSGIIVLDVDAHKGGYDSLKELQNRFGPLPDTLSSITANGGSHYFFKRPEGREVRNGQGIYGLSGVDVRGDGGYVVVPPSTLDAERVYKWDTYGTGELAELPDWIAAHQENRPRAEAVPEGTKNPPGTHHEAMLRVSGSLRHFGVPKHILQQFLLDYNREMNEPPCPQQEVIDLANDMVQRYPQQFKIEAPERPKALSLRATEFLAEDIPAPQWLVQGIWPQEAIGFIAGPAKSFKSFMALELAYAIATGADFLGRFKVPEAQKVLLIQQESSRSAFQMRVSHMQKRLGDAPNLYIISNRNMHIENDVDLERLEAEIDSIKPSLVFLDPLRSFLKGDENSAQVVGEVVRNLRRIRDEQHVGVAVIHHTTKQNSHEMSGSGALYGAAEAMMYVVRTEDREALKSRATLELKESEAPDPFYVVLDSETTALEIERGYGRSTDYEQTDHWSGLLGDSGR